MRDSSTQRAIIALSVFSRNESMAAVLHLLHAINPGLAAVGRFQGRCKLQTGNIIPFYNSQHKNSRASLPGFAKGARPGPPAGPEAQREYRLKRPGDNRDCGLFSEIAAYGVHTARRGPAALSTMWALSIDAYFMKARSGSLVGRLAACRPCACHPWVSRSRSRASPMEPTADGRSR